MVIIYAGRTKITIPLTKENVNEKTIQKYIDKCLMSHNKNAIEIINLKSIKAGKLAEIYQKTRIDKDTSKSNLKIHENHAGSMVKFKRAYMFGKPIKYSQTDDSECQSELTELNTYCKADDKTSKDLEVGDDVYTFGLGYQLVLPNKSEDEESAPFKIYNLDASNTFAVYSSTYTGELLFTVIRTYTQNEKISYKLTIYTDKDCYIFNNNVFSSKKPHMIEFNPVIEHRLNQQRSGIFEEILPVLDGIDNLTSNTLDNVVDCVNSIFYVKNMRLSDEGKNDIFENKSIEILTNDPARPADAGFLTNQINIAEANQKHDEMVKTAYDLVGVPRASTQITSGGDTGQARLLGGGWSLAETFATDEEISLKKAQNELLKVILSICRQSSKSKVKNLYAKMIEINFTRNMSDNLLVKTQSLQTLMSMNMPTETALNIVGLTSNPHEVAKEWDTKKEEARQQAMETQTPLEDVAKGKNNLKEKQEQREQKEE